MKGVSLANSCDILSSLAKLAVLSANSMRKFLLMAEIHLVASHLTLIITPHTRAPGMVLSSPIILRCCEGFSTVLVQTPCENFSQRLRPILENHTSHPPPPPPHTHTH